MNLLQEYRILIRSVLLFLFIGACFDISPAIQEEKIAEFGGGNIGKVIFDGKKHKDAGYHCMNCHDRLFKMKKGLSRIIYAHHAEGKEYCFACHNGTTAFDAGGNCYLCHKR
jgi:c(7)-type cytochrome triheme protein